MNMIGLDLIGADTRETVKSAAPGLIDFVFDAAEGKDKKKAEEEKAKAEAAKRAEAKKREDESPSFLSSTIAGPVKVWHGLVGAGAAVLGGLLWWRAKK